MTAFIDEHRDVYGVEPICRLLEIAPSTYYDHLTKRVDPDLRSNRSLRDEALCAENPAEVCGLDSSVNPWRHVFVKRGFYGV